MIPLTLALIVIILIGIEQAGTWKAMNLVADADDAAPVLTREENRIFCFIDLTGATAIAEELGHLQFANFLQDYYADIHLAIEHTEAEVYQYVGDEIVLSWPFERGLKNYNSVKCFYEMKSIIHSLSDKYMSKYGICPVFKAGLHGGKVTRTQIGGAQKVAVYAGDVLNTAARIRENCSRLGKEFLISGHLIRELNLVDGFEPLFIEATVPRGKKNALDLYSLKQSA